MFLLLRFVGVGKGEGYHRGQVTRTHAAVSCRSSFAGPPECTEYEALPGLGLQCRADGKFVWVGNVPLMRYVNAPVSDDVHAALKAHGDKAETAVLLAVADDDGSGSHGPARVEAIVAVSSKVRTEAADVVRRLLASNYKVVMLTGDNEATATAVARQIGITDVFAEVLPRDKSAKVSNGQSHSLSSPNYCMLLKCFAGSCSMCATDGIVLVFSFVQHLHTRAHTHA